MPRQKPVRSGGSSSLGLCHSARYHAVMGYLSRRVHGRAGAHGEPCRGGIPCLTRVHGITMPWWDTRPSEMPAPHDRLSSCMLHVACSLHAACSLHIACCFVMLCRSRRGRYRLVRRARRRARRPCGRPRALSRGRSHPPVYPIWHGYDTAAWLSHGGTVSRGMMRTQGTQRLAGNVPARARTSPSASTALT